MNVRGPHPTSSQPQSSTASSSHQPGLQPLELSPHLPRGAEIEGATSSWSPGSSGKAPSPDQALLLCTPSQIWSPCSRTRHFQEWDSWPVTSSLTRQCNEAVIDCPCLSLRVPVAPCTPKGEGVPLRCPWGLSLEPGLPSAPPEEGGRWPRPWTHHQQAGQPWARSLTSGTFI